jgi:hypothetical protein
MISRIKTAAGLLTTDGVVALADAVGNHGRRRLKYTKWRLRYHPKAIPNSERTILVNPSDIRFVLWWRDLRSHFGSVPPIGVRGGDWDLLKRPFDRTFKHRSLIERFQDGKPWEETEYYLRIETSEKYEQVDNPIEFLSHYDQIFQDMKENGYREEYPIVVNIGRNGELIRHNGAHRLSMARILDVDAVPIRVHLRHEQWQDLREEVARADHLTSLSTNAERRLDHPDIRDVV